MTQIVPEPTNDDAESVSLPEASSTAADAWDAVSALYNRGRPESFSSISYGPFCPPEEELLLLGEIKGRVVLDLGCGGGQNAVRFSGLGARVTALDRSRRQLDHARSVAAKYGATVDFVLGDAQDLADIPDDSQDLVVAANVFPYIDRPDRALASCRRVLRSPGLIVMSMDHPIRACFIDADTDGLTNYPERPYHAVGPRAWTYDGSQTLMRSFDRTVSDWVELLYSAGLNLVRLLEPPVPDAVLNDVFPADGPLASLRNIPHTLILVAQPSPFQDWLTRG